MASGRSVAALKVATHRAIKSCENCCDSRATRRDEDTRTHRRPGGVCDPGAPAAPAAGAGRRCGSRLAAVVLGLARASGMACGADLAERLQQPVFAVSIAAALVTAILAAVAAFILSLPDRSRWWLLLPAPALAVWVSYHRLWLPDRLGRHWPRRRPLRRGVAMLCNSRADQRAAGDRAARSCCVTRRCCAPAPVAHGRGLAVAAMTSSALSLIHDLDATIMILIWNLRHRRADYRARRRVRPASSCAARRHACWSHSPRDPQFCPTLPNIESGRRYLRKV